MINDPALTSDSILLQLYARNQDPEAFAELTKRYAGLVYGTCKRVLSNDDDAQDVSQECFLELARKAGNVRSSLPAYLHHLARTRSIDAIRKDITRRRHEQTAAELAAAHEPTWSDIAPLIDEALASLPERYRVPIILHYLQGHTQAQIANELRTSQPTTSRNIDKGITMLRDHLRKSGLLVTTAVLTGLLSENASTAAPTALMASLGKLALSGITQSATSTGIAALMAPMLGTLTGKLAMGIVGLAAAGAIANSAITAVQTKTTPITHITGPAAVDLGEKAKKGALAAANAITSGKGIVRVHTSSFASAVNPPAYVPYTSDTTYNITFSGRKYACEIEEVGELAADAKTKRPSIKTGPERFRIWSDGLRVTSYQIGFGDAKTGTITDANGVSHLPSEHSLVYFDVDIWSHRDTVIAYPFLGIFPTATLTSKQTAVGKQILNGDECIVVETTFTDSANKGARIFTKHWVNTNKGYALTKARTYGQRPGKSTVVITNAVDIELKDYGNGLWGPSRVTKRFFLEDASGKPELRDTRIATYDPDFQVNIPIDDKDLTFTVPEGIKTVEVK